MKNLLKCLLFKMENTLKSTMKNCNKDKSVEYVTMKILFLSLIVLTGLLICDIIKLLVGIQ